jgi:hypothetical protein
MYSEWQTHKDQPFFYCNYEALENDDLQFEIDATDALIMKQPIGSMLVLVNVQDVPPTRKNIGIFISSIPRTQKYIRKTAVFGVGLSGKRKVLFDAVMRITRADMMVFEDAEKAKDWLVQE